jgi:hypothetical protein
MGIHIRWDDRQQTRILIEFESLWTIDELKAAIMRADEMIISVGHRVDIIADIEGTKLPSDPIGVLKALLEEGDARANEGRRVVVGASSFIRSGYKMAKTLFSKQLDGRELLFADDLDIARAILRDT